MTLLALGALLFLVFGSFGFAVHVLWLGLFVGLGLAAAHLFLRPPEASL